MSSKLLVDDIVEKTSGHGVKIPGHMVQFVRLSSWDTLTATSTSDWADGASISITPKYNDSLILVTFNFHARLKGTAGAETRGGFRLLRDSTVIFNTIANRETMHINHGGTEFETMVMASIVDAPATTSSVTYKNQGRLLNGSQIIQWNNTYGGAIHCMEIAQ